ncbi:MAG TPA: response regulator [Gemmataceae bacterium]|jgi:PAS domain S-box-containing protein|nr:response regulator [Gemmataceae bacterium]
MNPSLRLFLVEDDDDAGFLMRKSLERAGHQVTVCHSGADALLVLGSSKFDLVLLDQQLPDIPGIRLLETLNREGNSTPVLMVTGTGDEKLASQVLRAGALDYIVKDLNYNFLGDLPKRVQESTMRFKLQQANRLLIAALESANDGILITDMDGTIQHVNAAVERLFGYDRDELVGKTPRLFRSDVQSRDIFSEMWQTIHGRRSWQGELVNRRKDGTLIDVSLAISPILDPQAQLAHFVGIYRDVSERKNIERQLFQAQKMQSVGTLAGGVAHEFNNLLAGIQGYASLSLRDKSISAEAREFLEFIVQLSERAANLTRQLLAFARKPALSRHPTSIARLLEATAKLIRHSLSIEVDMQIAADATSAQALADFNQLQQVLINLTLNARDAMPAGEPHSLAFRLRRETLAGTAPAFPQNVPPGDYLVIEVQDRGQGMAPEVLSQAFDPFFTTKEVGQGTGLGLPVAFGIINGHQGYLAIASAPGEGTCVRIYLPRLEEEVTAPAPIEPTAPTAVPVKGPARKVLVVDDEAAVGDVVRRFLEIAGHEVVCCTCAADGMDRMREGFRPDLIMLDLMIPREDGAANFRMFRSRYGKIPILLCTGLLHANMAESFDLENVEVVRKPFRMNDLWAHVDRAMGRRTE